MPIPKQLQQKFRELLGEEWYWKLKDLLASPYWEKLGRFIALERKKYTIIPERGSDTFLRAFRETPVLSVKIVILGQDPYHNKGTFDGLAFSNGNLKPPDTGRSPSLINILKEVELDVYNGFELYQSADLTRWANQGVLLINTAHTVRMGEPGSHLIEWRPFTIKALKILLNEPKPIVYMLWGKKAQGVFKEASGLDELENQMIIDNNQLVLTAAHPSPFSAHNGFFGCGHFTLANKHLEKYNIKQVQW